MSPIAADRPLVRTINSAYSRQLLEYNNFKIEHSVGRLHKVHGFAAYNFLLDINAIFSNSPAFDPVDRTKTALGPVHFTVERAWQVPTAALDLHRALELRVHQICSVDQPINLMWSGGIDSTAIVVAFLQYAPDPKQLRVIYSPWSVYEHPDFFAILKTFDWLELIDISDLHCADLDLEGTFVSGNSGDEMHASLDQSFFATHGIQGLARPWQDFFRDRGASDDLIAFCNQHFALSGRPIHTVLEARWWFYCCCKLTSLLHHNDLVFFSSGSKPFDSSRLVGFFDCAVYEQFIYFNLDQIIISSNYETWKQFLKDFCCEFDGLDHWRITKTKAHSTQVSIYAQKRQILNNRRYLMLLDNGILVSTNDLPFFGQQSWDAIKPQYSYVFRSPS